MLLQGVELIAVFAGLSLPLHSVWEGPASGVVGAVLWVLESHGLTVFQCPLSAAEAHSKLHSPILDSSHSPSHMYTHTHTTCKTFH